VIRDMPDILLIKLAMKLLPKKTLSRQARKPSGPIGRYIMTRMFNSGNADLNAFVQELLDIKTNDRVLEIGFGPGKLIAQMAEQIGSGRVEGIDFSAAMLEQASKANRSHIETGKVKLYQGECLVLPFADNSFDKLCAINILYFWKQPERYFREMWRVLKPQGKIVIGFRDAQQMSRLNFNEEIFTTYSQQGVVTLLKDAGFANAYSTDKDGKPFISYCVIATKLETADK